MKLLSSVLLLISMIAAPSAWANSDPTAPLGFISSAPAAKKNTTPRLPTLSAILCSSADQCSAVLNNQPVAKGQRVNGYVVSSINDERVVLSRGGKRWSLTVFNEQVVQ